MSNILSIQNVDVLTLNSIKTHLEKEEFIEIQVSVSDNIEESNKTILMLGEYFKERVIFYKEADSYMTRNSNVEFITYRFKDNTEEEFDHSDIKNRLEYSQEAERTMFTSLELNVTRTKFHDVFEESSIIETIVNSGEPAKVLKRGLSVNAEDSERPGKNPRIPSPVPNLSINAEDSEIPSSSPRIPGPIPSPEIQREKRDLSVNAEDSGRPEKNPRVGGPRLPSPEIPEIQKAKRNLSINAEDSERPEKNPRVGGPRLPSPEIPEIQKKRNLSVTAEDSDRPEKEKRIASPIVESVASVSPVVESIVSDVDELKIKMERAPGDRERRIQNIGAPGSTALSFDQMKHVELRGNPSNRDLRIRSPFVSFLPEERDGSTRLSTKKSETSALLTPKVNFSFDVFNEKFDQKTIHISNEEKLVTGRETRNTTDKKAQVVRRTHREVKSIEEWEKQTDLKKPVVFEIELNKTSLVKQFRDLSDHFELEWDNSDFARLAFILVEIYGLSVESDGKMVQLFEPRRDLSSFLVKN